MSKFKLRPIKDHYRGTFENFDIKNISNFNPDIVVVGNSISRGNIELEWILDNRLSIISLPDLIKSYFILLCTVCILFLNYF